MADLTERALRGLALFLAALAVFILLPAWSLTFWQGWLYWLVFAASAAFITLYFLRHSPALIERRLHAGAAAEREPRQKRIQSFTSAAFMLLLVVPGLDHLFGWSDLPPWLVLAADVVVVAGFAVVFLTFRVNPHASGIIEVAEDQAIVSRGPYALVRHPMYAGAALIVLATPLALGSAWSLPLALPAIGGMVWRLIEEERFLLRDLPGYADYCTGVRYRLVPLVW